MAQLAHFWRFANDAERTAAAGGVLLFVAALALLAERHRSGRATLGQTGWVPWTGLFLAFALAGMALLSLALPAVIQGR